VNSKTQWLIAFQPGHGILTKLDFIQKETAMSLTKSWYTLDEAAVKFGLSKEELQELVDLGLVRSEEQQDNAMMLNGDDIEQQLNMVPSV